MLPTGLLLLWLAVTIWSSPDDGTDVAGMLGLGVALTGIAALAGAVTLSLFAVWRRGHPPRPSFPSWQSDPWRQGELRYWDGDSWTDYTS